MAKKKRVRPNKAYVQKTREKLSAGEWWTPERGVRNIVRVMPPYDEEGICILRRVLHYGFEMDGRNRAFPCLEDNEPWLEASPCPVCHVVDKMSKGDKDEREAAGELKAASAKFVVNIVDCKRPEKGVQLWSSPLSFGRYFISLLEDEDIEDVTDPDEGYDIIVEVSGKGRGTKYDFRMKPKPSKIKYEEWEAKLNDLRETLEVLQAGELIDLLRENYGNAFDIDQYLEDFSGPVSSGGQKKNKKEKEWDEDEEVDENDIRSMKLGKARSLAKYIEMDPDDYDDLDELKEAIIEEMEL